MKLDDVKSTVHDSLKDLSERFKKTNSTEVATPFQE